MEEFQQFLPVGRRTRLGEIDVNIVDDWFASLNLGPSTKRNKRTFLAQFFKWAKKRYKLVANPMLEIDEILGAGQEDIVAIRNYSKLTEFLKALEPFPYWNAWVSVACLAGPRWSKQQHLKIDHVYFGQDGDYIRVASKTGGRRKKGDQREMGNKGTKTGRERNVGIEQSILKNILQEHLHRRKSERRKKSSSEALRGPLVFPSTVPLGPVKREKSRSGLWSDNSTWRRSWGKIVDRILGLSYPLANSFSIPDGLAKPKYIELLTKARQEWRGRELERFEEYWSYGPAEWRHTCGTALAMSGYGNELEIADLMGNTPEACRRHYIAQISKGRKRRWPLKW